MLSRRLSKEYDLLILEKPNIEPFEDGEQKKELLRLYSVDQLSQIYAFGIDTYLSNAGYSNIILFGHSEGGVLVPPVYNRMKAKERIDSLVIASAGGMSQEKQMLLLSSRNVENPSETQEILSKFSEIYNDPDSIIKFWWGHPYKRWASFLRYKSAEDIERIDIPILLYHGRKDKASPVEASRMVFDEYNKTRNVSLIEDDGDHGSVFWNLRAVEKWIDDHKNNPF
jgi:pimeloyl-ACP methyl ester carboxylesterase